MNKRRHFHLKSKHILTILTIVCIGLLVAAFASDDSVEPLREASGFIVTPFENGITNVGDWLYGLTDYFRNPKTLAKENKELKKTIEDLQEQNTLLEEDQKELERLQELYDTDEEYSDYDKVLAKVIAKDSGNWYNTFTINKGSSDGIEENMNVISAGGLVGIVTETGAGWANVRSIIDDGNNVSAMTLSDEQTCMITGDLELIDSGLLAFSQLEDSEGSVTVGQKIVTSHISDKYLEGILVGTIKSIEPDEQNLTYTGTLIPAVDFSNLQEVFVITELKEKAED